MSEDFTFWRDPVLGDPIELETRGGRLRAFSAGEGPPIVFVHGALVNANLWRGVVPHLADRHRCVTLELPLGSHELPMPDADLSPTGLADLIADAIRGLGIEGLTLVGNDTGGALCQIALARHPELAERLVLTSCDAYDQFPPAFFRWVLWPTRWPAVARALFAPLRIRALRDTPLAYGWLMHRKLDRRAGDSYVLPILTGRPQGADFARVIRQVDPRYTEEAIATLRNQERPTLIAWSADERFFKMGERLAADLPGARLEWIEGARTFSMEDRPERVAELIREFAVAGSPAPAPSADGGGA